MSSGSALLLLLIIWGKLLLFTAGYVTTRQHCPNKVLNLRCEALENADQNSELEWHWVHNNKQRVLVALCNRSLECGVVKASIEGMKVLGISNGTLLIERSPRKTTSGSVELVCTVHTKKPVRSQPVKLDLSLECIWTQVGADVNLTSYLNNILPWKRVHEVELWDTAVADRKMFAYCNTNGCTLEEGLDQTPSFGNRLKTFRRSILLTRIQECDEGLEILVKVQWRASFHKLAPRSYTLRIRLRPNQDKGPANTPPPLTSFNISTATESLQSYDSAPVLQTKSGAVVGKIEALPDGKTVYVYLGIPYAEPPVGELRFAAPNPAKPWSGIKEAREFGSACPQPDFPVPNFTSEVGEENEDCLYLNVFVPSTIKSDDKMAVMVWIHGGGFAFGSSTEYPGHVLAAFNDVIVVTFNYRLGILGFLNIPGTDVKGNYGMFDQILVLKWVQANIASFGGDPNRVTIFGESAGGMSVSLHLISPKSQGLFHRAIVQSGASSSPYVETGKITSGSTVKKFATLAGCPSGGELIRCLSSRSAQEIVSWQTNVSSPIYPVEITNPVVDGDFLPDSPQKLFKNGKINPNIDVITGFTTHEGALKYVVLSGNMSPDGATREQFEASVKSSLERTGKKSRIVEELVKYHYTDHSDSHNTTTMRKLVVDFENDVMVVAPTIFEANALAKAGNNVYLYVFEHRADFSPFPLWTGAVHGVDIGFVFGAPFRRVSSLVDFFAPRYSDIEKGFSWYIMKLWTDFAKFGSPTPPSSNTSPITWPRFTKEEQFYLALDVKPSLQQNYRAKEVEFWNSLIPKVERARRRKMSRKPR